MRKYFSLMNHHSISHKRTKPSSTDNKADTIEILTKYYEQKINSLQHQIDILRNEFKQDINNLRQNQNYNNTNNGNSGNTNNTNNTNATTNPITNPIIKTKSKRNEHNSNTVSSFFHIKDEDKKIMLKTHHQIYKVHTNTIIKHNNNKINNNNNNNNNNTGIVDFYNKKHNVDDSFKGKKQRHTKSSSLDNNNNSRNNNNKRINVNRNNTYNKNNINKIQAFIVLINSSVIDYELKCKMVFLCKQTKQYIHNKQHLINISKDNIRINKNKLRDNVKEIIHMFPSKTAVLDVNFCSKDNESCIYSLIGSDEVYSQFYDIVKKMCNVNQNEQKQSISKLIYTYIIVYRTIVFTIYHTKYISI